jgi:hypothetical protein
VGAFLATCLFANLSVLVILRTRILAQMFAVKTFLAGVLQMVIPANANFLSLNWVIQHSALMALGFTVPTAASHDTTATCVAKMLVGIR